ncbi:MAG: stage III sporulation protein AG [Ruminococcaceae bacterium]|nr:stage III sporulation protein AG [Oscillospiraceae bacterium]
MDIKLWKKKAFDKVSKHKYALAVLILGIALMLLPGIGAKKDESNQNTQPVQTQTVELEEKLSQILCRIQGAGKVEVLLTCSSGEKTVYQEDADLSQGTNNTSRYDTVIIKDGSGKENGLVQQIIPPKYQGAIVVCQGADKPAVRLAVVEAVSRVTGLGADQISVLKMK